MTVLSDSALRSAIAAAINDNSAGDVTPADVRNSIIDFLDSISARGGLPVDTRAAIAAATIPAIVNTIETKGFAAVNDGGRGPYNRRSGAPTLTANKGYIQSADGAWWELDALHGRVRIEQFGGKADFNLATREIIGVTDNLTPFNDAVNFLSLNPVNPYYESGAVIEYGYGGYYHSDTLIPTRTVTIQGPRDTVLNGGRAAHIIVPDGVPGVVTRHGSTDPTVISAAGTTLRDIAIAPVAGGSLVTTAHGVKIEHPTSLFNVTINAFGGNGVNIVADVGSGSNANVWYMERVYVTNNVGNGVFLQAGDSNAGTGIAINAIGNGGWGIRDDSFLGNTWIGVHTASNTLGCFKATDPNARSVFIGCYQEGDQPNAQVAGLNMMIGGIVSNDGGGPTWTNGLISGLWFKPVAGDSDVRTQLRIRRAANEFFSLWFDSDDFAYRLRYDPDFGVIAFNNDTGGAGPINITSRNNTLAAGRSAPLPHAQITFPNSIFVGPSRHEVRNITNATAMPTSGSWAQGDFVYNQTPSISGGKVLLGWSRITTGSAHVLNTDWAACYCTTT